MTTENLYGTLSLLGLLPTFLLCEIKVPILLTLCEALVQIFNHDGENLKPSSAEYVTSQQGKIICSSSQSERGSILLSEHVSMHFVFVFLSFLRRIHCCRLLAGSNVKY